MTAKPLDPVITPAAWQESQDKLRVERDADPQFREMAKAHLPTKDELAAIADAEQRLREAEAEHNAAGLTVVRARQGIPPTYDHDRPFSFFERQPSAHKAALAAMPGLTSDLKEAELKTQSARRRLNAMVRDVNRARAERRQAAKLRHAPKAEPVQSRNSWAKAAMNRWGGRGAA